MNFGAVVVAAGLSGLLSFAFLAVAIGSEYWYIIDVDKASNSTWQFSSSHSGLWRTYEEKNGSYHDISIYMNMTEPTEQDKHLSNLHRAIVILLPVSLVLLVFGGIFGLVASLARSYTLLTGEAVYFLVCSFFTLSGVCIYVSYSEQALDLLQWEMGTKLPTHVHVSFGWSLVMACLSYSLELTTSFLLLLAARLAYCHRHHESTVALSMA
ncbi:transmembrane protein 235-like [Pygocentrus nattereri]|uniref:transmembrane protein 235-like n=1 Tax=Pygocentrus nattereri TaxID=42514 RepID=UPI0008144373|nr:transmembrane protein 235-like [Pygocentrus nattereri]